MKVYSNEIVFRGHPDKVCDQISDALLDAYLKEDPHSRCGIEVMGGKGKIFITGEVTSKASISIKDIVNRVLTDIGYDTNYEIINNLGIQSPDIALGTNDKVGGAGDQGMMFGYACNDTEEMLPTAMVILQTLSKWYDNKRKELAKIGSKMISEKIIEFIEWIDSIKIDPTIESLNDKCLEIREDTLDYIYRKTNLDNRDKKIIDKMLTSALKRLIREPIINLKQIKDKGKREEYIKLIEELFEL